jgi:hypothetical protein
MITLWVTHRSLLSLGILTVMSGLIGIIATFTRGCCLVMYFGVGLVSFLMQVVVLVGLFFYYDWVSSPTRSVSTPQPTLPTCLTHSPRHLAACPFRQWRRSPTETRTTWSALSST